MSDDQVNFSDEDGHKQIDYWEILLHYLSYWKWIVVSVLVCLLTVFLYLRYTPPIYNIYSTILLKDDGRGGNMDELSALQSWGIMQSMNNVENEIEILYSWNLAKAVVNELSLHTFYAYEGRVSDADLYNKTPVFVTLNQESLDTLSSTLTFNIELSEDGKTKVKGLKRAEEFGGTFDQFPFVLTTPAGKITFTQNPEITPDYDRALQVTIVNPVKAARSWLRKLDIGTTSKATSVIRLAVQETRIDRGVDFLNILVAIYNREGIEDKNRVARNMEVFIDERLSKLNEEMGIVRRDLESYKKTEKITELKTNSEIFLRVNNEYQRELVKMNTQLNLIQFLEEYMKENAGKEKMVPANLNIADPVLQTLIAEYNKTLMERDRLLRSSSWENPYVMTLTQSIRALHTDILTSISGINKGLLLTKKDLDSQALLYDNRIGSVPTQERELTEKMRNQQVLNELFMILSRKKEENALTLAVPINKAKVIDNAMSTGNPVSPKRSTYFLIALAAGVLIPLGGVYLYDLLNYRIKNRRELEKLTSVPVLGEIPVAVNNETVVVKDGVNNNMAESFRAIRTNLLFMNNNPGHQVVMVTSSMPGEGKTFVSVNLAVSLALLNKKILLIGLDIRKPMLASCLHLDGRKGMTNYLASIEDDLHELIQPSGICANLQVITSGIIPPNPAELLQNERLDYAVSSLRAEYDYIIIDSAPIGLVTDTLVLSRVADSAIYITRENYTHKKHLEWLNELMREQKLPLPSLVLNAVAGKRSGYYGYGNGAYGYSEEAN